MYSLGNDTKDYYLPLDGSPVACLVGYFGLSSLPVAHISDNPRRQLVVTGDSAWIKDKLLRVPPGSLTCSAFSTVTRGAQFSVSSVRLLVILIGQPEIRAHDL